MEGKKREGDRYKRMMRWVESDKGKKGREEREKQINLVALLPNRTGDR